MLEDKLRIQMEIESYDPENYSPEQYGVEVNSPLKLETKLCEDLNSESDGTKKGEDFGNLIPLVSGNIIPSPSGIRNGGMEVRREGRGPLISQGSFEEEKLFERMTGLERGCVTGRNKAKVTVGYGGAGFGAGGFEASTPKISSIGMQSGGGNRVKTDSSGEANESPKNGHP